MPFHDAEADAEAEYSSTRTPYRHAAASRAQQHQHAPRARPSGECNTGSSKTLEAKLVVMGNTSVGKTSLVTRYTEARFSSRTTATTGAMFVTHKAQYDDFQLRLQIWDTAGQERFRSLAPIYYRGANAAIVMYDITRLESFNDVRIWIEELRKNCEPDLHIYIVGSKSDLSASRQITPDRVRATLAKWFPADVSSPTLSSPAVALPPPSSSASSPLLGSNSDQSFAGGGALNLNAYLLRRPRFTSLTSAYTVNSGSSNGSGSGTPRLVRANTTAAATAAGIARRTAGVGGGGGGATRAQSLSVAQAPARLVHHNHNRSLAAPTTSANATAATGAAGRNGGARFNSFQSFDALPTISRPHTATGAHTPTTPAPTSQAQVQAQASSSNAVVLSGRGHHRERSWGPGTLSLNIALPGSKSSGGFAFPSFLGGGGGGGGSGNVSGRGSEEAVSDEEEGTGVGTGDDIQDASGETEWGLGRYMRLFEVSAKDGNGVDALFDAILGAVVEKREIIDAERRARERDSILLHVPYGPVLEEDESREKEGVRGGWSCC